MESSRVDPNRIGWIDKARGIAILLVVIGHSFTTVIRSDSGVIMFLYYYIYFFHTRLLFFLSGFSYGISESKYRNLDINDLLRKKFKRLIVPYIAYSFLIYTIFNLMNMIPKLAAALENIGYGKISIINWSKGLISGSNVYSIHLWYIYTLFFITIIVFIFRKFTRNNRIITGTFFLLFFINFVAGESLSYIIRRICEFGIYFVLGIIFREKNILENKSLKYYMVVSQIYLIFNAYLRTMNSKMSFWGNPIFVLIFSIGTIISVIFLSMRMTGYFSKLIDRMGLNSYVIYIFHQPFWGSGVGSILYGIVGLPIFITVVISIFLSFTIPLLILKVLNTNGMEKLKRIFIGG